MRRAFYALAAFALASVAGVGLAAAASQPRLVDRPGWDCTTQGDGNCGPQQIEVCIVDVNGNANHCILYQR